MIERRGFCAAICEVACATALAGIHAGCAGDASSTTAPSGPSAPGSPHPTPAASPPPAAAPPSTSGTIAILPLVPAILRERAAVVTVGPDSPLFQIWGAARARVVVDSYPWDFLLTRTGPDAFSALLGTCTHHGCTVTHTAKPVFVCPCHGSRFDHNGEAIEGPASAPLQRIATRYADGVLTLQF
jgi:nitrite reductase/ring-hydroxylating ferredoxin subunit